MQKVDIDFLVSKIWNLIVATYDDNIRVNSDEAIVIESQWEKDCKISIEKLLKTELEGTP